MAYYYKVPARIEYKVVAVEIKDGERLSADAEVFEEEGGKRYRKEITDEIRSVVPDIPAGYSYVCELLEDGKTFFVKSDKPIRFAKERESVVEAVNSLSDARSDLTLSGINTKRVMQWFAGRRRK